MDCTGYGITPPFLGPPYEVPRQGYGAPQPLYSSNTSIPRVPLPPRTTSHAFPELAIPNHSQALREGQQRSADQASSVTDSRSDGQTSQRSDVHIDYSRRSLLEPIREPSSAHASESRDGSRSREYEMPANNPDSNPQTPPKSNSVPPMERPTITPGPTSGYRTIRSEPIVPTVSTAVDSSSDRTPWTCDTCMSTIPSEEPRIHCTACDDYDLCASCYRLDRTSKSHISTHRVRKVRRTMIHYATDFCHPSEKVNPDVHGETGLPNWTIDEDDTRWNHLRKFNSHDRYLVTNVSPGHYILHFHLGLKVSEKLTADLKRQLEGQNLGELRIVIGFPKDKSDFLHQVYPETKELKDILFEGCDQKELVINPAISSSTTRIDFPETTILHVDEAGGNIGVLLQWSNMKGFKVCNEALVQISIPELR
jgi:hypothetical protein